MIDSISSWARQIITCVILVTVIEMILPKGNSKKYIKTIMGVYILYTIISPAIKMFTHKDLKIDYSQYEKYFNTSNIDSKSQVATVEDTYKIELQKKLKKDVEEMGYLVKRASAVLDTEKGAITQIVLSVEKKEDNKENVNIMINKIDIGSKYEENTLSTKQIDEIKEKISKDYEIDTKNITINSI